MAQRLLRILDPLPHGFNRSGIQDAQESFLSAENQKELMRETKDTIMQVIIRSPGCSLEEIILECPDQTWNQVFCEIDRMSRTGQVRLTPKGQGRYGVSRSTSCDASA